MALRFASSLRLKYQTIPCLLAFAIGCWTAESSAAGNLVLNPSTQTYSYVPSSVASPATLIVILHGAGGNAQKFLKLFKKDAEGRGAILLSIGSTERTWPSRKPTDGEADVIRVKQAIADLTARTPIDSSRTTIMGFSDGASYALSVGMAYPDLFRTIVAFSPGYAFSPKRLNTDQRIFIAHGRRDRVLPADNARQIIKGLESAGFDPEVHWFNGGHEIDPQLKQAGIDFALKP